MSHPKPKIHLVPHTEDPIVNTVIDRFIERFAHGMERYGVSMADNPKGLCAWLDDAQEEAMDLILYIERAKLSLGAVGAKLEKLDNDGK